MRILFLSILASLAASCGTHTCNDKTLLLEITIATPGLPDTLEVVVAFDDQRLSATQPYKGSSPKGTLQVEFPNGYPRGKTVKVTLTAIRGGETIGTGSSDVVLAGACERVKITVSSETGDGGIADAATDMPPSCAPTGGSATQYVDGVQGTDDPQHGGAPGSCAYRTLTYALTQATDLIVLAGGKYGGDGGTNETFPLIFQGAQHILCPPSDGGAGAVIEGQGTFSAGPAIFGDVPSVTISFSGTQNAVKNCKIAGLNQAAGFCVLVMTDGVVDGGAPGHGVSYSEVSRCGWIAVDIQANNVKVANSYIHDSTYCIDWPAGTPVGTMTNNLLDCHLFSGAFDRTGFDIACDCGGQNCLDDWSAVTGSGNRETPDSGAITCENCNHCPFQ